MKSGGCACPAFNFPMKCESTAGVHGNAWVLERIGAYYEPKLIACGRNGGSDYDPNGSGDNNAQPLDFSHERHRHFEVLYRWRDAKTVLTCQ
jgi:hypothetical protein